MAAVALKEVGHVLDESGVAAYLGTTPRHVQRLRWEHGLPYTKVGRKVRFVKADVDVWLARNRVTPVPTHPLLERATSRRVRG